MTFPIDPRPAPQWPGLPDQTLTATAVAARAAAPPRGVGASGRVRGLGRPALLAAAFIATFGIGIGIGRVDLPASDAASPAASFEPGDEFALIQQAWDTIHKNYVAADELDDRTARVRRDRRPDRGRRRHRPHRVHDARGARPSDDRAQGQLRRHRRRGRHAPDGLPMIVGVFRGSPAEKAGLHAGDVVLTVDDKSTVGETLDGTVSRVRGERGTTVVPDGSQRRRRTGPDVKVVRDDVHIEPVSWSMVPGTKTAVLRLEQFSTGAADELHKALEEITRPAPSASSSISAAIPAATSTRPSRSPASSSVRNGVPGAERRRARRRRPRSSPAASRPTIPLVVLVDEGSASAAEIVRARSRTPAGPSSSGRETFGTGTVLGEFALADGSALRIGTVEWLTPKGRVIWHEGIAPDVAVVRPTETTRSSPTTSARCRRPRRRRSPIRSSRRRSSWLTRRSSRSR